MRLMTRTLGAYGFDCIMNFEQYVLFGVFILVLVHFWFNKRKQGRPYCVAIIMSGLLGSQLPHIVPSRIWFKNTVLIPLRFLPQWAHSALTETSHVFYDFKWEISTALGMFVGVAILYLVRRRQKRK